MMHAGLGLALAERIAPELTPYSSAAAFRDAASRFASACRAHAREGYVGAAYESLGLVVRTWHPQLVPGLDATLRELDEGLVRYFWHGAGRALYFLPNYIIPGVLSPWRAAEREAPHETARENLYAGLAWATTLVNMRHPQVMAQLLSVRGETLARAAGFVNGLASAIVVRIDTTPADPYILAFARYDAAQTRAGAVDLWNRFVRPAVRAARSRYHPLLSSAGRLDLVFRYANLDDVAARLERGEPMPSGTSQAVRPGGDESIGGGSARAGLDPASRAVPDGNRDGSS